MLWSTTAAADSFQACIDNLARQAGDEGIAVATITNSFQGLDLRDDVLEHDAGQPEFSRTFLGYYPARVSEARVQRGRELLTQHEQLLLKIQYETGVPPHYLLAFWGLETNFGGYLGKYNVVEALTTLACRSRRSEYFTGELMNALRILERGDVDKEEMVGSWAGAMGNMQFMPTTYLKHAQDGDGDGRRDLWGSRVDALTSAGRFLQSLGWQPGLRWGREILLPEGFDYQTIGTTEPLSTWSAAGVTDAFGRLLPAQDTPATILLPAGHAGPAFITYHNFGVIMGWNRSEFYALSVGRLADRIAGAGRLTRAVPEGPTKLAIEEVQRVQQKLIDLGYSPGEADGFFGPATRKGLAAFQAARGLIPDGALTSETLAQLDQANTPGAP